MNHETFIEDLKKAFVIVSKHDSELAGVISKYIGEIIDFDDQTGFVDMSRKDESIFRLDCPYHRGNWKAWQRKGYETAKQYDGMLFTADTIAALVVELQAEVNTMKNHGEVRGPNWAFCREYGTRPYACIGEGCTLTFEPVKGYFMAIKD